MSETVRKSQSLTKPCSLDPKSVETLNHLFNAAPPGELRESLIELYHSYLKNVDEHLPANFDSISRHMYHLIHCLADLQMESRE